MQRKVQDCLKYIKDPDLKEHYSRLILTLLEKGYFPGLKGVPVVKSGISQIDGEKGILSYRGYPIQELAEYCSYEDVCYLLLNGDLPLKEEKEVLKEQLLNNKEIKDNVAEVIIAMDDNLHPMYMLSAGILLLESNDPGCLEVTNYHDNLLRSIKLIAKIPTILGIYRSKDPDFASGKKFDSYGSYCVYCLNQNLADDKNWVEVFEKILILHADHTMNNSTFSVRAVGSSQASIYASISSAVNSLSGPLHGGANERVLRMLEEIAFPENAEDYVEKKLDNHEKIMGIGHRVYKTYDPRAVIIKKSLLPLIFEKDSITKVDDDLKNLYETACAVEKIALDKLASKGLYPNVDFWSGLLLKGMGIDPLYFTTIFAMGRMMGWTSHWIEHMEVKNRIFRPLQLYDGFNNRHVLINRDEEIATPDNIPDKNKMNIIKNSKHY